MSDDDGFRCIHAVLNEAATFAREENPEDLPRLDAVATAIRDTAPDMHIEINDPQVIEGMAAGIHLTAIRAAAYLELGVLTEGQHDGLMCVAGELIQALGLMYVAPPTASLAALREMFPTLHAATEAAE